MFNKLNCMRLEAMGIHTQPHTEAAEYVKGHLDKKKGLEGWAG